MIQNMPQPTICHLAFTYFPGYTLTEFFEFARHEAAAGFNVHAIAPGQPTEPVTEHIDQVHVWRVPVRSLGWFTWDRLRFVIHANRMLRQISPDIVHVYAFPPAGLLPWLSACRQTKWFYDIRSTKSSSLRNRFIRLQARSFDRTAVISEGTRSKIFGPTYKDAVIVAEGADFDRFQPRLPETELLRTHNIAEHDRTLIYTGTLDRMRRLETMLAAVAQALTAVPQLRLVLVGDGNGREDLEQLAQDLGISDRVTFVGYVPMSEVPRYLSIAEIALSYVPKTAMYETQPPLKTVEYMAAGLPVIATDTGGNKIYIRHKENGLLADDGQEAFAHAILELVQNPSLAQNIREQARASVQGFNVEQIVREQLLPLYRQMLS